MQRNTILCQRGYLKQIAHSPHQKIEKTDFNGIIRQASLDFLPEAKVDDYVLVHVGFAISRVDEEEARTNFAYMQQVGMLEEELGSQPESFSIAGETRIIGTVTDTHVGRVTLRTSLDTDRIVDMLSGDKLPRIC
jgi:hydrogenase expression/formation protein HypC